MSKHYCMYKDGMCELDIDEAYQQGKSDAFQEIAYSDSVIKEPFETLAYKKGKADAIEEFANELINPSNYERFDFDDCLDSSDKANDFSNMYFQ